MKRIALIIIAAICAFCFSLTGCGSSSGNSSSYDAAFVGTWNVVEMSGSMNYGKEQMEGLRALGAIDIFMNFEEDGTVVTNTAAGKQNSAVEGTWRADSPTQITITINGSETQATLDGDKLSMTAGEETMILEKVEHRDSLSPTAAGADAAASAGASGEAAELSQESAASEGKEASAASSQYEVSIDGAEVGSDYNGNPALIVTYSWVNNSDKTASYASCLHAKCFQNGVQLKTAIVFDGVDGDGYMSQVRPGYGTTFQLAYELKDAENPIDVEVSELISFNDEILASKTFEL